MVKKHVTGPFALSDRDIIHHPGEMREHTFDAPAPEKWGEGLVSVAEGEPLAIDVRL